MLFDFSLKFRDDFNRTTRRTMQVEAVDSDAAKLQIINLVNPINDITQCQIISWRIWEDFPVVSVVTPGANVDQGLTSTFELEQSGSDKKGTAKIPAPTLSIFDANGALILTDVLVLAYESAMFNQNIRISDGEVAFDLLSGKLDK